MANGTRLARLKMLEDGGTSHHKSRKLEKLETTSSLKRKLETAVKKLPESPVRRSARMEKGGTSSHMNSQKCASPCVTKNQTEDGGIGPTNSSYINKSRSPTVKKRKDDSKSVSSSTDNCIGSDSPQSKRKKVDKNIVLEVDKKSEDNGKKTVRKHLHIRAYKRMIAKHANKGEHANKGGNAGTNICMEAQDSGDKGSEKLNFEDKREQCNETLLPSNKGESENTVLTAALVSLSPLIDVIKEYETEFCVGNNGQQNHNSNYGTVVESSKRGIANHDCLETNKELFYTVVENPGLYGGKASDRDCRITTNQQVAEENINVCTSEPAVDYETSTAFTHNLCLTCKQPGHLIKEYHDQVVESILPFIGFGFCCAATEEVANEGIIHLVWIHLPMMFCLVLGSVKWRKEWSQPERLLLRRLVVPPEVADEHISVSAPEASQCWIEWFVKWRMLEYDRATWESENSLLSHFPEAARLIEDYERRRELARRSSDPMRADKASVVKEDHFCKLSELPVGCSAELDNSHLTAINCLREFWCKSVNAVFIDDQLMFELVNDSEAIIEDLDYMTCIGWDTIIVDKCQNWKMSGHLEQLKCLNAHFKLVLLNGQLKDSLSEYRNILSFINVVGVNDDLLGLNFVPNEGASALAVMKLKLARHIAYECKVESSKFLEYWVPVPFSNVQLEQYCAFFVSNSSILRSNSKSEVVGALHSILIDARKCCDHPYLVDGGLRGLLTRGFQGAELLNAEVCLSGKLFLLDKILQEMKIRGLRVVILFQGIICLDDQKDGKKRNADSDVEEKLLVLAKEDTLLDSDVQNISRSSAHSLLGWGASHLFHKLDQFHSSGRPTCISEPSFDKVHLDDVISDIFSVLPGNDVTTRAVSFLIKAQQVGATYSRNIILIGEKEDVHKDSMLESDGGTPKLEEQRNLLMLLRPELSELCDILALPDPVKDMAQEFLVYIMNNHDVSSKQVTVLQALMISLCWRAASISKHSLQRIGSLALAKRLMKFECSIEEARSVYSRLRILKKKFRMEQALMLVANSLSN
ncbi:hypothetical protein HPP92_003081 [Vanilla planifolia]|uniref:Chromo domain-containing protein n=1 Tax=Vanilla planifolia TaxID=51239 RepID=A0A835S7G4_VANPL|nr:hypothetical protein HPP92_003081 [Vanilla planifolia]